VVTSSVVVLVCSHMTRSHAHESRCPGNAVEVVGGLGVLQATALAILATRTLTPEVVQYCRIRSLIILQNYNSL
jgi:hypothetical protein